jgi:hypothetical protein
MTRLIELSEEDYARLERAAEVEGITPAEWVTRHLPTCADEPKPCSSGKPAQTLAERFAGRVGVVASGGTERLSERHSEVFGDMLQAQRKAGRL